VRPLALSRPIRKNWDCVARRVARGSAPRSERIDITGKRVIAVQTKATRLGMYLMGQTIFTAELLRQRFSPASVESIALCAIDDEILRPMLEAYPGCRVVVMPQELPDAT
jgi:hypothetical protein